ncbi:MAG TPA: SAM-dependent methyltransferase [Erythrobacter sp.]|nr:SAM-dependent methyltransferase [Erythrobacter sp.]
MKQQAPATERNREPIAEVLQSELPNSGLLLEIASGTGEHGFYLASRFPNIDWQPSDPDPDALASIAAWRNEYRGANLREPMAIDATSSSWPVEKADAMLCINMVHISPWEAAQGLFAGAGRLLRAGAPLILYGPYFEQNVETASSNLSFDDWLKARNPRWGLRDTADIDALAALHELYRTARYTMPANNIMLVYRAG